MIKGRPILSKEIIFSKISSEDIFREYCSPFNKIGEHFSSELRVEKAPSCSIAWIKGDLLYRDFGEGLSLRAIDYVMTKFNLNYWDALEKIYYDFKLDGNSFYNDSIVRATFNTSFYGTGNCITNEDNTKQQQCFYAKQPTIIRIKKRAWNQADASYWKSRYNISRQTLEKFDVVPVSHFWINDNMFVADKLAYCYNFYQDTPNHWARKIYQPFSKTCKWLATGSGVVQGEGMLPYSGDLLIITKSLKDIMCLYTMGYTAISPTSETSFLPEKYLLKQEKRFKKLVLFLDQDTTGVKKSKEFSEKWNIPYILIPEEYKSKDLSDLIWNHGIDKAKQVINKLLCE
jgi:hypothetical protein